VHWPVVEASDLTAGGGIVPRGHLEMAEGSHTPQTLTAAFRTLEQYLKTGDMRGVDWRRSVE